jgi:pyruvate ferredoxin oxidoreductase alpha subunit
VTVLTANEAAAVAADLARVQAVGCYPITPQTVIVERLADLTVGRDDVEFANLESEHSMFGWVIAAARAGVRTFTATSSQGLLYAHEQLQRASRERVPLVAVNVNRAIFAPWSIEPDLSDSMAQRDAGWIQLYCANAQEVLDSVICAYRIAETALLPVLVCAEGFLLSHTSESVDVPTRDEVGAFLPPFRPPADWVLDPEGHRSFSALPETREYAHFQRNVAEALDGASSLIDDVALEFEDHFGRRKIGSLELSGNPQGSRALVAIGTIGETALELLEDDDDLLIVRVHAYRPLPAVRLRNALAHAERIVVVDRAPAFGALGPLGADVRGLGLEAADVVCGLGGGEVTPETLRSILEETPELGAVWR